MRLRPKYLTATSACPGPGTGFGIVEEMNRDEAGPFPPSMSGGTVRIALHFLSASIVLDSKGNLPIARIIAICAIIQNELVRTKKVLEPCDGFIMGYLQVQLINNVSIKV
jgi:hypothetical protein